MNIFSKLREFVGLNDPVEYEYDEYEDNGNGDYRNTYQQEQVQSMPEEERNARRRMRERISVAPDSTEMGTPLNNVIGMPGTNHMIYGRGSPNSFVSKFRCTWLTWLAWKLPRNADVSSAQILLMPARKMRHPQLKVRRRRLTRRGS